MLPVLIEINGFPVHTYGVLIALGFLLAVRYAVIEGKRLGLSGPKIADFGFYALIIGMIGARVVYIFTRWNYFIHDPSEMFRVWEGGLVFYGGPIAAFPFLIWFCKKNALPIAKVCDIAAVALPIAHGFGRFGCLSAGCCHGRPTAMPWGIKLNTDLVLPMEWRSVPLHPTQLYEAGALFGLAFWLHRRRLHKRFDGELAVLYVLIYAVIRTVVEIFRGDAIRGFVIPGVLSTSQFISIFTAIAALMFWKRLSKGKTHAPS